MPGAKLPPVPFRPAPELLREQTKIRNFYNDQNSLKGKYSSFAEFGLLQF